MISDFDTNLKLFPPIRDKKIIKEIIKQIQNGTIDVICSDHSPVEIEKRNVHLIMLILE